MPLKDLTLGVITLLLASMAVYGSVIHNENQAKEAFEKGRLAGIQQAYKSAKEQIEADPNYTRVLCKLWWFGMDNRDRSVK